MDPRQRCHAAQHDEHEDKDQQQQPVDLEHDFAPPDEKANHDARKSDFGTVRIRQQHEGDEQQRSHADQRTVYRMRLSVLG